MKRQEKLGLECEKIYNYFADIEWAIGGEADVPEVDKCNDAIDGLISHLRSLQEMVTGVCCFVTKTPQEQELIDCACGVLVALNGGDISKDSLLHKELKEKVINYNKTQNPE